MEIVCIYICDCSVPTDSFIWRYSVLLACLHPLSNNYIAEILKVGGTKEHWWQNPENGDKWEHCDCICV